MKVIHITGDDYGSSAFPTRDEEGRKNRGAEVAVLFRGMYEDVIAGRVAITGTRRPIDDVGRTPLCR